jgi:NAD(P)-dependent dehydrogenase (short-subunit alcohol dehydrogenase family)
LLEAQQAGIECFVHCAGTLIIIPIRSASRTVVEEIMNVNFASAVEITRLLATKKVNEKNLRSIVFVSSTASKFGARGFNLYCASKGALDALMRALAVELAPNVRVNSVLPGAVRTNMTNTMMTDSDLKARFAEQYPLGIGETSDVASAIEFLISDKARWITGQQLIVDGGCSVNITA